MKQHNKGFIYFICLVSAMGGLLFGYDWVVIGGAKPFYEQFYHIADTPFLQGWTMSIAVLGCLIGAVCAGMLADRYGRKKLLILAAAIFLLSAYWTGMADTFTSFLLARFVGGVLLSGLPPISPRCISRKFLRLK